MITRTFNKFSKKLTPHITQTPASKISFLKVISASFKPQMFRQFSIFNASSNSFNRNHPTSQFNIARQFSHVIEPLGPLDGRYQPKIEALSNYFSESAFNRYRIQVEIEWMKFLIKDGVISLEEGQNLEEIIVKLDSIYTRTLEESSNFNEEVKEIEAVTNHDIKAVEYWIKQRIELKGGMDNLIEFVHFTCTSEDINNISYALMLKDSVNDVLLPEFDEVYSSMRNIALEVNIFYFGQIFNYFRMLILS